MSVISEIGITAIIFIAGLFAVFIASKYFRNKVRVHAYIDYFKIARIKKYADENKIQVAEAIEEILKIEDKINEDTVKQDRTLPQKIDQEICKEFSFSKQKQKGS